MTTKSTAATLNSVETPAPGVPALVVTSKLKNPWVFCIVGISVVLALLWCLQGIGPLSEYKHLLDIPTLRLLLAGPLFMLMFGLPVALWAYGELTKASDDLTGKSHVIAVLALGMLGASVGGLFIYPLKFAAVTPDVKAGFDALLVVCGTLASTGVATLTTQAFFKPPAGKKDKPSDKEAG